MSAKLMISTRAILHIVARPGVTVRTMITRHSGRIGPSIFLQSSSRYLASIIISRISCNFIITFILSYNLRFSESTKLHPRRSSTRHLCVQLSEPLTQPLASLDKLLGTVVDASLFLRGDGLGGEIVDAVFEAP